MVRAYPTGRSCPQGHQGSGLINHLHSNDYSRHCRTCPGLWNKEDPQMMLCYPKYQAMVLIILLSQVSLCSATSCLPRIPTSSHPEATKSACCVGCVLEKEIVGSIG